MLPRSWIGSGELLICRLRHASKVLKAEVPRTWACSTLLVMPHTLFSSPGGVGVKHFGKCMAAVNADLLYTPSRTRAGGAYVEDMPGIPWLHDRSSGFRGCWDGSLYKLAED